MANQIMRQSLYHSVYGDPEEDVLEHHGVSGMEWGERNGPPYPLSGANKRHAIKEWMENRKKKKRLKKLQKAAKKARKEQRELKEEEKKQAKKQESIEKFKQKLVKEGNIDKIKKNAKLFTNEELAYIADREQAKRGIKSAQEYDQDEKFNLMMKRMGQLADIGSKATTLFQAGKAAADMVAGFKGAKLKDLEADEKLMKRIKDEFDTRSRINPDAAIDWFNVEMQAQGREGISRPQQGAQSSGNDTDSNNGGNSRQRPRGARNRPASSPAVTVNAQQIQAMRDHLNQTRGTQQNRTGATGRRGMVWRRANQSQSPQTTSQTPSARTQLNGSWQRGSVNTSAFDRAYQNRQGRIADANRSPVNTSAFDTAYQRRNSVSGRIQRAVGSNYDVTPTGGGLAQPTGSLYQTRNDGRTFTLSGRNRYSGTRTNAVRSTPQYSAGSDWATGFITTGNGAVIPLSDIIV